jgi:hypothetical protein
MQTPKEIVRTQFPDSEQVRADQKQAEHDRQWNITREYNRYCLEFDRKFMTPRQQRQNELGSEEGTARQELARASRSVENFLNSQKSTLERAAGNDYSDLIEEGKTDFAAGNALRAQAVEAYQKQYPRLTVVYEDAKTAHAQAMKKRDDWLRQNRPMFPPLFSLSIDWKNMHA